MFSNHYTGIVETVITRLITSRARRLRLCRDELEDLQQQIVLQLLDFVFDEAHPAGASLTTAITGLIDRQIRSYLRSKTRYQKHVACLAATHEQLVMPDNLDLQMDVAKAMEGLSARDREICTALAEGLSIKAIARQLGRGRDTIDRAIGRIRRRFEAAGLREWVYPEEGGTAGECA
jgi:RNA polymerase sigma factor (sigma-70 family)